MEIPKFIILLCCIYHVFASEEHHSHNIPVENYDSELQDLGQHVEYPETPVKVVKITKTIAVKIPVPYPVKIIEKVPYPVHIAKPYPVPVPQIVHVPQPAKPGAKPLTPHEALDVGHGALQGHHEQQSPGHYQVQESPSYEAAPESYNDHSDYSKHFGSSDDGHSPSESGGNSYDAPSSYYSSHSGHGEDNGSHESKNYDQVIKQYLQKHNPGGNSGYPYH